MSENIFLSNRYTVKVSEDGLEAKLPIYISLLADGTENNIKLPEDVYKEFDGLGQGTKTLKTYFTSFEFNQSARVSITMPRGVKTVCVKPDSANIKYTYQNNVFEFVADATTNFVIEPDGDIFGGLHIFCNKKKNITFDKENIIEFAPGVHTVDNCEYIRLNEHGTPIIDNVKNNTLIYIPNGAIVNAALELIGVKNVKITGSGIISLIDRCHGAENGFSDDRMWGAFRYYAKPNVYIRSGCSDIEVEDVVLNCEFRGIVLRNSENIKIKNVKMFTSTENADGINCYNVSNLLVDGCYIQSADDCFCMYNSCDSIPTLFDTGYDDIKAMCKNVEVKNCVMSSNARPIVLGGHATGCTEPRCVIEDINIHDCEIIETPYRIYGNTREYSMYWSGFLRLLSQSEQIVRNITFKDITIEVSKGHNGKPVHIEVRGGKNASYAENKGYKIENISFENITVKNNTDKLIESIVRCRPALDENDRCSISGIYFKNFTVGGRDIIMEDIIIEGNATVKIG